ncbi:MAG: hypothetical protein OEM67_01900 [Thermoleophilia bacterium]|nr:hypothetical protein [Thermoleophilia bacterium]
MASDDKIDTRIELLATLLLSLATIATAWSVYEATRWSGVQAVEFSAAGSARTSAAAQLTVGAELGSLDSAMFSEYRRAERHGDFRALADLQSTFFRDEFRQAFEAWRAQPDRGLARTPFEMSAAGAGQAIADRFWHSRFDDSEPATAALMRLTGYEPSAFARSDALSNQADLAREAAKEANQVSDNYVLTTVLFACVLFFAGICTKFASRILQSATIGIGSALFVSGSLVLAQLPYH